MSSNLKLNELITIIKNNENMEINELFELVKEDLKVFFGCEDLELLKYYLKVARSSLKVKIFKLYIGN